MTWARENKQGNEAFKIRWEVVKYTRGKGIDLGCGPYKLYPHFIGVDNNQDEAMFGISCKPDVKIQTAEDLSLFGSHSMDFVFSSHLLEHIEPEKVAKTLKEWTRLIKKNGFLVLYLPDKSLYPNVGQEGANPDHRWDPEYETVVKYMETIPRDWDLVDYQFRDQDEEYSGLYVFEML